MRIPCSAVLASIVACSAAYGETIVTRYYDRQFEFAGFILVDGVDSEAQVFGRHTGPVRYSADVTNGSLTSLELLPGGGRSVAERYSINGHEFRIIGGSYPAGVDFAVSVDGANWQYMLAPYPPIFAEPMTWGGFLDNMDGTFHVLDLAGPYHFTALTVFDQTINGTQYQVIIDFYGWEPVDSVRIAAMVPEPSTWVLLIAGLAALPMLRRRKGRLT